MTTEEHKTLTVGSLFSGYGGLDMAVEAVTGARPAWFVEYDKAPSKILAHHWPDVPNYGDVTAVDWETMPPVDILTGGYPCQPFSQAGRRKGTNDDRHLWPYVREAIRHLRPRLTILENVAGHRSLGFDRVLGDMAEDGLHVRWTSLRASDIGAPHHRERLFIIASLDGVFDAGHYAGRTELGLEHAVTPRRVGESGQGATYPGHEPGRRGTTDDGGAASPGPHGISVQRRDGDGTRSGESGQDATDTGGIRRERGQGGQARGGVSPLGDETISATDRPAENATDPKDDGRVELDDSAVRNEARSGWLRDPAGGDRRETYAHPGGVGLEEGRQPVPGAEEVPGTDYRIGALPPERHAGHANADRERRDGRGAAPEQEGRTHDPTDRHSVGIDFGPYAAAVRRWERLTRPAPAPTELNTKGNPRLNAGFAEWMMGLPAGHITQVPGISRAEQLKATGNGVCPPQAAAAIRQLLTPID